MLSSFLVLGQNRIHLEEVDSTNVYAQYLLSKTNPTHGTVITADYQTHGKGQFDRNWVSDRGKNILMSLILYPEFLPIEHQAYLNFAISVGVLRQMKNYHYSFCLKWPNDIYTQNKKIGGVLIQNQIQGIKIKSSIVGIGLNINQEFEPQQGLNATSLYSMTKTKYDHEEILGEVLTSISKAYHELQLGRTAALKQEYVNHLMYINEGITFYHEDKLECGIVLGVDDIGNLLIENNRAIGHYAHGTIRLAI